MLPALGFAPTFPFPMEAHADVSSLQISRPNHEHGMTFGFLGPRILPFILSEPGSERGPHHSATEFIPQ